MFNVYNIFVSIKEEPNMKSFSRREFLGTTGKASAATALFGVGAQAAASPSKPGRVPAADKVRIGIIGYGGMGSANLADFLRLPEVDCAGIAEVDETRLAGGLKAVEEGRGRAPEGFKDFRKLLERKDIDAVVVSTPDHWHALATIFACQAGKDVYVEKPMATSIAEGRAMVAAARRFNRVVQVGTQQRSSGFFQDAVAFVRSGALGRIRMVRAWAYLDWKGDIGNPPDQPAPPTVDYDMWLGPAPERPFNPMRFHHNFRWFWDYSGGLMTDWGAHMIDVVVWAMGEEPLSAASIGGKFGFPDDIRETPDTQQALIEFPSYSLAWEHMIGCGQGPWQREHGCEFHGANGILVVDRGGWEVHSETDKLAQPERLYRMMPRPRQTGSSDFHFDHVRNFVECIKSRQTPTSDVEVGHKSLIPSHLANIAYRLRRRIAWDAAAEQCAGDAEAQALVGRTYRAPWALPVL
jgi:predicted dehydrogenase